MEIGIQENIYVEGGAAVKTVDLIPPSGKEYVLYAAYVTHDDVAGRDLSWRVTDSRTGFVFDSDATNCAAGVTLFFSTAFPDMTKKSVISTPTYYITAVTALLGAAKHLLVSAVVLKRPLNWDIQNLEWTIKHAFPTPPGFAKMIDEELGYRTDKDML